LQRQRPDAEDEMTIELDFSKLRGPDVLDMAIAIENEAQLYYEQLADWTGNDKPEVADFFKRMAVREKRHHDQIVDQRERLYPDAKKSHADAVSWAVEAPDYDAVPNDVTLKQAFDVAMDAETRAHDFYAGAIEFAADDQIADLFEGLRKAEADHQRMLRDEMAKYLG
jgi:rubrerythrin